MRKPSDAVYFHHMLDATQRAESFAVDVDEVRFQASDLLQSAIAHQAQIIGEAARQVSPELKAADPETPWTSITGTRHRVVHDYVRLNTRMVWLVVRDELPAMRHQLQRILELWESRPDAT